MIIVVDFGSQTAHLIGRRLRSMGISVEYVHPEDVLSALEMHKPTGLIFSGGPASVYAEDSPDISGEVFDMGLPVLGLCYGWQLMAKKLGGTVVSGHKEYGPEKLSTRTGRLVNEGEQIEVWMSHGDTVVSLPEGFRVTGSTKSVEFAAVEHDSLDLYGFQFHPEVEHTESGEEMLQRFVEICGEVPKPLVIDPQQIIEEIRHSVGDEQVLCAVSGGVDSTVAAFLIGKAIGKRLIPVYVESGLMRPGTRERVEHLFTDLVEAELIVVEVQERFMAALNGIEDPEEKRKVIGKLYIEIFQEVAQKHSGVAFLGQGTIYSDVIESKGSKKASKIKSHHNVGGLPKDMDFSLIEPLRNYYKDEVRWIGREVGIPEEYVNEHPFPGPGYAIRIRGAVTYKRLEQEKLADQIVCEEIKKARLYDSVFQCFAVMTGAYSTAVKGDERAFAEVVAVRVYESTDVMTSRWAHLPYGILQKISSRIVNEVPDISRVVYDITTKPPATMEWE